MSNTGVPLLPFLVRRAVLHAHPAPAKRLGHHKNHQKSTILNVFHSSFFLRPFSPNFRSFHMSPVCFSTCVRSPIGSAALSRPSIPPCQKKNTGPQQHVRLYISASLYLIVAAILLDRINFKNPNNMGRQPHLFEKEKIRLQMMKAEGLTVAQIRFCTSKHVAATRKPATKKKKRQETTSPKGIKSFVAVLARLTKLSPHSEIRLAGQRLNLYGLEGYHYRIHETRWPASGSPCLGQSLSHSSRESLASF
mgnify:CR=1 FL=1